MLLNNIAEFYSNKFHSWNEIKNEFDVKYLEKPEFIIYADYIKEHYSGDATVVYYNNESYYLVKGSHCSCYGLENQWKPERYTYEEIFEIFRRYKNDIVLYLLKQFKESKESKKYVH